MNPHRSEPDKPVTSALTSHSRFPKAVVTALIASAAVLAGSIPLAGAQDRAVKEFTITETRNMRFCEILVVKQSGVEVYNTAGTNDCPPELWNALDLEMIKKQFGALTVQKNGPKFWMMDTQTVQFGEKASLGGLEARWAATLDPRILKKAQQGSAPYKVFTPKKTQYMVYAKGKKVFEVVDTDCHAYVLQARGNRVPGGIATETGRAV